MGKSWTRSPRWDPLSFLAEHGIGNAIDGAAAHLGVRRQVVLHDLARFPPEVLSDALQIGSGCELQRGARRAEVVEAGHVERKLLDLEAAHPGALEGHVLKVPHHGSQTASTQALINAVNPQFAIISASTKHHLPKDVVVTRYQRPDRVILRTDEHRENNTDHVVCGRIEGDLQCNFADILVQ